MLRVKELHDRVAAQAADLAKWNKMLEQRVVDQVSQLERAGRLKRFLAPQVAELVLSEGIEQLLDSHRHDVTVVFGDLRGFTAFAETAEPEEVMGILREYHTALGPLVHNYEGTIERFIGDGFLVLFNDPLPCPDAPKRAIRMAAEMRACMAELSEVWRKHGHELGVCHGYRAWLRHPGPHRFEGRFDYSAIGTVVNLAARLCSQALAGQILIDPKVYAAVETEVDAELAGELTLKELSRAIRAFNIKALLAS